MANAYCPACDKKYMWPTKAGALQLVINHIKRWAAGGDTTHIGIMELEGWEEQPFDVRS